MLLFVRVREGQFAGLGCSTGTPGYVQAVLYSLLGFATGNLERLKQQVASYTYTYRTKAAQ